MEAPNFPNNEAERLLALQQLNILDTPPEERFDRLTRMARHMFQVPIALVSLVDAERQWFKSVFGLEATETPRDISFCGHAILESEVFVIEDAPKDPRFADNPLVAGEPKIRFYAGCPIHTPDGSRIGTLCVIDSEPREFSSDDRAALADLAYMVDKELANIQLATMDPLTCISNRRGFQQFSEQSLSFCARYDRPATIAVFDLDNFKPINDTFGHAEGDQVLKLFASQLKHFFRKSDLVARIGGDEFAALMLNIKPPATNKVIERLQDSIRQLNRERDAGYCIDFSVGMSVFDPQAPTTLEELLNCADGVMYQKKRSR